LPSESESESESPSGEPSGSPVERVEDADEDEALLRRRLTAVAVTVLLLTAAALAIISALGQLLVDPSFRVSETLIGMFVAALLALLGIKGIERWTGR